MTLTLMPPWRPLHRGSVIKALLVAAFLPLAQPLAAENTDGGYRLLELDGYRVKWGEQTLGAGATISYAFADETLQFDGARNCRVLAPMNLLSGQGIDTETLEAEAAAAFRVWERAADLRFHRVANARNADIVIGTQGQPHSRAFANVSYTPGDTEDVKRISQSLVCLNPEQKWKVGFGGDQDVYDIRYTLIHEIGHAIGLDHPGPAGQVMGFRYTETFPQLQPGDLRGVRELYGPGANDPRLANGTESSSVNAAL